MSKVQITDNRQQNTDNRLQNRLSVFYVLVVKDKSTLYLKGVYAVDKEKVLNLMNEAIELEYQAFMQYFYQSLTLKGFSTMAMAQFLAQEADIELGHAKMLAEKVVALGDIPTSNIAKVKIGETPRQMIEYNIEREKKAVAIYKELKELAKEDDALYRMIDDILIDELNDIDEFDNMLG